MVCNVNFKYSFFYRSFNYRKYSYMKDFAIFTILQSQGGITTLIANYTDWRDKQINITSLEFQFETVYMQPDFYYSLFVTFTTE